MLGLPRPVRPSTRQIYALAAVLCELAGEEFPETRDDASDQLERLRQETGHPRPRLEDNPLRNPRGARRRRRRLGRGEDAWPGGSV